MVNSDSMTAGSLPAWRRFFWGGFTVLLLLALALVAGLLLQPSLLSNAKAAIKGGLSEADQLWFGMTHWLTPPYPESPVIKGFELDWSTHRREAHGSGDWGTTWADDDHQYTAWGNGGGFGASNVDDRVFLGFARIEGNKDDYRGINVWGGAAAENPAEFGGKAYSLLSVDGQLYTWRCGDTEGVSALAFQELYRSVNHGATWRSTGIRFTQASFGGDDLGFYCPVFLQFGRDYEGARDDYIYVYAPEIQRTDALYMQTPGEVTLMRVPKSRVNVRSAYEFFAGTEQDGAPIWTFDAGARRPVLEDPENGISQHIAAVYHPGLDRYILTAEHTAHNAGNIAVFDAPTPWGPWTTAHFSDSFGRFETLDNSFMWVFPSKWLSVDSPDFVMIYTGKEQNDSWNTVEGRFIPADPQD